MFPPTKHGHLLTLLATLISLCKGWQSSSTIAYTESAGQFISFADESSSHAHAYVLCTGGCEEGVRMGNVLDGDGARSNELHVSENLASTL